MVHVQVGVKELAFLSSDGSLMVEGDTYFNCVAETMQSTADLPSPDTTFHAKVTVLPSMSKTTSHRHLLWFLIIFATSILYWLIAHMPR